MSANDPRPATVSFDGNHRCPVADCPRRVPDHQLMCGAHWRLVSPALRRHLYATWGRGAGRGSPEHAEAMALCVEEVEFKLGAATR